jgi:hypothetical protein
MDCLAARQNRGAPGEPETMHPGFTIHDFLDLQLSGAAGSIRGQSESPSLSKNNRLSLQTPPSFFP